MPYFKQNGTIQPETPSVAKINIVVLHVMETGNISALSTNVTPIIVVHPPHGRHFVTYVFMQDRRSLRVHGFVRCCHAIGTGDKPTNKH